MKVEVTKLTDVKLLQRANGFTTGRSSSMTLATAYRHAHSPIRTQLFWVECTDVPLFVASQIVRSHVGVQFFQRSKRVDRGGEDFAAVCTAICEDIVQQRKTDAEIAETIHSLPKRFDRFAPTDIAFIINAEALMNMSHKRLCAKASYQTRELMMQILIEVSYCDSDLAKHLVPQCVFRGGICPEPKSCGYINQPVGRHVLQEYRNIMNNH